MTDPRVRQRPFPSRGSVFALVSHPGACWASQGTEARLGSGICFQAPSPRSVVLGRQPAGPPMGLEPCRKEQVGRSSGQGPLSSLRLTSGPFGLRISSPARLLPGYELVGAVGSCSQGADHCVLWGLLGTSSQAFPFPSSSFR